MTSVISSHPTDTVRMNNTGLTEGCFNIGTAYRSTEIEYLRAYQDWAHIPSSESSGSFVTQVSMSHRGIGA